MTPPDLTKETEALGPEGVARAKDRAVEMALLLAQWVSLEHAVSNAGLGLRERFHAVQELRELHEKADRLVSEVVG